MPEDYADILPPVKGAICQAFDECLNNHGMKTVVQVKGFPHQVKAYPVGNNQIRIDVVFMLRSSFMKDAFPLLETDSPETYRALGARAREDREVNQLILKKKED